jgi:hypothetical protein
VSIASSLNTTFSSNLNSQTNSNNNNNQLLFSVSEQQNLLLQHQQSSSSSMIPYMFPSTPNNPDLNGLDDDDNQTTSTYSEANDN